MAVVLDGLLLLVVVVLRPLGQQVDLGGLLVVPRVRVRGRDEVGVGLVRHLWPEAGLVCLVGDHLHPAVGQAHLELSLKIMDKLRFNA